MIIFIFQKHIVQIMQAFPLTSSDKINAVKPFSISIYKGENPLP